MVWFYELSCLAKSVYFILQETVLWFNYFICGIGGDGVGKVFGLFGLLRFSVLYIFWILTLC